MSNLCDGSVKFQRRDCKVSAAQGVKRRRHIHLIETAIENGLDPYKYLVLLFQSLPNRPQERWDDYFPGGCGVPDSCRCPKPKETCYAWEEDA